MKTLNANELNSISGGNRTVTTTIIGSDYRQYTVHRTYNNAGELVSMTVHPTGHLNEALCPDREQ